MAFSPGAVASYAISVRQASVLPAASFRFHLTMDTLAVRLIVPLAGPIEDLHLQVTISATTAEIDGAYAPRALPGAPQKNGSYLTGRAV